MAGLEFGEQRVQQRRRVMEICGSQRAKSGWEVEQALARGLYQDAERAGDPEALCACRRDPGALVNQEKLGSKRVGQRDCGAFARVEPRRHRDRICRIGADGEP